MPAHYGMVVLDYILPVNIEACNILPLSVLETYLSQRKMVSPYAAVGVKPTTDITICHGVGLPPLGSEADGQSFQHDPFLGTQNAVY